MSDSMLIGRRHPRIMFHVQHLLGHGHLVRVARLARAINGAGIVVTLASGGEPVAGLKFGRTKFVQLPPVRASDETFATLVEPNGAPIDDAWRAARAAATLQVFQLAAPDALLIEMFPFGRRKFAFELMPLLDAAWARPKRPLVVASVRDIVIPSRQPGRAEETISRLSRYFDHVLVHGDPALQALAQSYPAVAQIAGKLVYTGYVAPSPAPAVSAAGADGQGEIIVSAGGGAAGDGLLSAALGARAYSSQAGGRVWRLLVGANAAAGALARLQSRAPAGVIVEAARADFPALLRGCACSVSQAGYNSVVEILQAGARSVLAPFAGGNEQEQSLRAGVLEQAGRVTVVRENQLNPETLAAAVDAALLAPVPSLNIDLNGAAASAEFLRQRLAHVG